MSRMQTTKLVTFASAALLLLFMQTNCSPSIVPSKPAVHTSIIKTTNDSTNLTDLKVGGGGQPHHLFIGRYNPTDQILHQENIIVHSDGKSHVNALIKIKVEGPVNITCVKIYDEIKNGGGGYPKFIGFGDDRTSIEFEVLTDYGKGFHFFVQIFGINLLSNEKKLP